MTYTIIAKDEKTGNLGIAMASRLIACGNCAPFIRHGVGIVSAQATVKQGLGESILDNMQDGMSIENSIKESINNKVPEARQILAMNCNGDSYIFTGEDCGKITSEYRDDNIIAAGNLLSSDKISKIMVEAYKDNISDDFEVRLCKSLIAGDQAGGDKRGLKSTALRILPIDELDKSYRSYDLRVDYSKNSIRNIIDLIHDIKETQYDGLR